MISLEARPNISRAKSSIELGLDLETLAALFLRVL